MQTRRTRKITNKTKEQTGNQEKSKKKRRKIRKDNPRTRERSQLKHITQTPRHHYHIITTSQQGKTRATNRNITNKATNQRHETKQRNENATKQRTATTHTSAKSSS